MAPDEKSEKGKQEETKLEAGNARGTGAGRQRISGLLIRPVLRWT